MSRIAFFIDGFNLFHALDYFPSGPDHSRYNRYKWISLARLARCFVTKKDRAEELLYFTTLATWNPEKVVRHKLFIKAQEAEGVQVVYGEFKRKERRCPLCNKHFWTDFYHKMKEKHLVSSRLPDVMKLSDGTELVCPPTWR